MNESATLENAAIKKIFAERKDFVIIGLTGRTGCGCSTVAKLLCKDFTDLQPPIPESNDTLEDREYKIIFNYSKENWVPFRLIEMKHIILTFILENDYDAFINFVKPWVEENEELANLKEEFNDLNSRRLYWKEKVFEYSSKGESIPCDDDIFNFYFLDIPSFYESFQKAFRNPSIRKYFKQSVIISVHLDQLIRMRLSLTAY